MADGRWYCYTRYKTWDGETKQHKKTGFKTKREAQEYEKDFLLRKEGSPSMTFASLVELYLEDGQPRWKKSTYDNRKIYITAHLLPTFGDCKCDEITPAMVRKWQTQMLGKDLKVSTVKQMNDLLSTILQFGKRFYGLRTNASTDAGSVRQKVKKTEMQFYTLEEFNRFISVESDRIYRLIFLTLYYTGMRVGELQALTPEVVGDGTIHIAHTFNAQHGLSDPKTDCSDRTIQIPGFLNNLMHTYIKGLPNVQTCDRIFERISADMIRRRIKRNAALAGVKEIRIHDFRHSHASYLINAGYSPVLISKRLGHANPSITLNIYSHLYPSKETELMDDLEQCYKSATIAKIESIQT